ncbi:Mitogen-activated protein kinase kinase kinase YODA [Forsythia ovata]|uniref:mitogen-activated protein kinase kinase kinase n=1 Tax=Forsythia ovata TaxID=205694 RepID=A0ABD1WDA2_9LAMI
MPSWWGKSSKEVKKKNKESVIDKLQRKCIGPGAPRTRCSDTISEKGCQSRAHSRSPSSSTQVSRCQSFADWPHSQPLPLPGGQLTNIQHADCGIGASTQLGVDRGSQPISLLPLPKPGHVPNRPHAVDREGDLAPASISSDSSSNSDDPSDSRLLSPQAFDYESGIKSAISSPSGVKQKDHSPIANKKNSGEMLKLPNILLNNQTGPTSPKQKPLKSSVPHLQIPPRGAFFSALDSSMSSPSRSPIRVFGHDPVINTSFWPGKTHADIFSLGSGQCSTPGSDHNSGHNSIGGDTSCQLFWPHSSCSPEYSPLPSPRTTSAGPGSRIQSGAVTPLHPHAGGPSTENPLARPDDRKQQSHRLPLPPIAVSSSPPFSPSYSAGTSPSIPRSPGRTENPLSPGSHWKKGRLLGTGAFGHVYLGFNIESGEMCAMKEVTLFADDAKSRESAQQLRQEVALLSRLRHPNIVLYYGSEMVDDKLYIYLEYVSGGSIYKILKDYGRLGEAAIRSYTQQILSGLAYLHAKHTVHRDIKGANILVDPNGRVKLADFGMAKHITGQSCPLSFKGSPYWMAPEVINNASGCNLAVDIWSLGCTVLEMATTKPPWSQYEGVAAMFKVGNSKELPAIPDHLSDEGKDFVRQCLQRNPLSRPTAIQLLEHPFVKKALTERPILNPEPLEAIPAITNSVRSMGFGHSRNPPCLDLSGAAVSLPRSPKMVPGFSDAHVPRNISCPVSPLGSPQLLSRSPQHMSGRLSPSPMSSPRATSVSSSPLSSRIGALPLHPPKQPTNYLHEGMGTTTRSHNQDLKPDIFWGIARAHLSQEIVSSENSVPGERVGQHVSHAPKQQLYEGHLVLADRVSQQLLRNPVRLNPTLDLNPNSAVSCDKDRV